MGTIPDLKQRARELLNRGQLTEAVSTFRDAIGTHPNDPELLLGLGITYARTGNFYDAQHWMKKASDIVPENPFIHIHLANTLIKVQRLDDAKLHYQLAISIQADNFEAHFFLATLLMTENQLEDAEYHYKHAIRIRPDNADCHANLAQVYELLQNLKGARDSATKAIELVPNHSGALLVLGRVYAQEKHYSKAEKIFRDIIATVADKSLAANALVELGLVLDRMERYEEAYDVIYTSKLEWSRINEHLPFDKKEYSKLISKTMKCFTEENVMAWENAAVTSNSKASSRASPIFLVGFPRSGTTLTEQVLNQHPEIVTSDEKPFLQKVMGDIPSLLGTDKTFPECLFNMSTDDVNKLRESYWQEADAGMESLKKDSILVDKQPLNLIGLGLIARVFPDAHILVAIRDPRDVCLSCYMQKFALNPAMINFLSMESTVSFYTEVMNLWMQYRKVLPINWHQYRYEDLVNNFDATTREIFEFLNLEYPANTSEYHITAKKRHISTPSSKDVAKPIYTRSAARWKHYENHMAPYISKLEPFIEEFGY